MRGVGVPPKRKVATSNQKVATSDPKVATSDPKVATSDPKVATSKKYYSKEELIKMIVEYCVEWRTLDDIKIQGKTKGGKQMRFINSVKPQKNQKKFLSPCNISEKLDYNGEITLKHHHYGTVFSYRNCILEETILL